MKTMDDGESFKELRDPQEREPQLRAIIKAAKREAEMALHAEGISIHLGYCHRLWARQKRILKEQHGIDWKSPAELNPDTLYD